MWKEENPLTIDECFPRLGPKDPSDWSDVKYMLDAIIVGYIFEVCRSEKISVKLGALCDRAGYWVKNHFFFTVADDHWHVWAPNRDESIDLGGRVGDALLVMYVVEHGNSEEATDILQYADQRNNKP